MGLSKARKLRSSGTPTDLHILNFHQFCDKWNIISRPTDSLQVSMPIHSTTFSYKNKYKVTAYITVASVS